MLYKMPHSKNKQIFFNGHKQYGTLSCSCGKVMEYLNTQERAQKAKLHMKVCKNPPKEAEVRKPKVKSMALKEALQYSNDRNKRRYTSNIFLMEIYWGPVEERGKAKAKSLIYIDSVGAP